MADRRVSTDTSDSEHPPHRRRESLRDTARVADDSAGGITGDALRSRAESRYGAPSTSQPSIADQPVHDQHRALRLRLTTPDVVAISDKQHDEAVDLLAAMIVAWVQHDHPEPDDTTHLHP
jgi:hypothetical protein